MRNNKVCGIYILSNKYSSVFYIGVTTDLINRIWQHRQKLVKGFTSKYNINKPVYYEVFESIIDAIKREKYIKGKKRSYKLNLIESINPSYKDLYLDLN